MVLVFTQDPRGAPANIEWYAPYNIIWNNSGINHYINNIGRFELSEIM